MQDKLTSLNPARTQPFEGIFEPGFFEHAHEVSGMNPAKFTAPRPIRILDRERLLDRLIEWDDKKLVVIHAQAGHGKTTLAVAYSRTLASLTVWYTMDPEDDDPAYFLSSLGRALQLAFPADIPRLPVLPPTLRPLDLPEAARSVAGQLLAALSRPCLIVFDDLHATSSPVLLQLLTAVIDASPAGIRFMVLSRIRPDLKVAGLRAQRAYGELSGNDLRFSDSEVEELFSGTFGMHLPAATAALINRSAEGWPAGLVLMHEYLATAPSDSWSRLLSDGNRKRMEDHIFDYLAQEVFSRLPEVLQQFLMRTCLCDPLPLRLAGELASASPARVSEIVSELLRRNLFISPFDDGQPLIRYHSLFREFLHGKLSACERPSEIRKLAGIAFSFFMRAGDPIRAVDVQLAFGQYGKALRSISALAPELISRGQTRTLLRWMEALPEQERGRPWFLLARAISCRFTDARAALGLFENAFTCFRSPLQDRKGQTGQLLALCGIIEECFHSGGDFERMERAAALAHRLLQGNRRAPRNARAKLLLAMGMAWFFTGRLAKSRDSLLQALELFAEQADVFYQITCAVYLTPCALYLGDFGLARETLQRGFEAHKAMPGEIGGKAGLLLTRAMTALFEGNFAEARDNIDQCKELAAVHSLTAIELLSLTIAGWLSMANGDLAGAALLLADCKNKAVLAGNAFFTGSASHLLAITFLFQNKPAKAERQSDEALAIRSGKGSMLFHAIYLIASGAIHMRRGKAAQAERELRSALRTLKQAGSAQQEANCHLVLALLEQKRGNRTGFRKQLREGLSIGRDLGFTYYAVLTAEEQSALARQAVAESICTDYCRGLLEGRKPGLPLLSIYCMGGFKVYRGSTPVRDVEWKSKRAKTLVKLLVAHEGQKLAREQAMDLLWPETAGKDGAMFNAMLHRVRRVLEPGVSRDIFCIYREGDSVGLNRDLVWTDVGQFRAHLDRAARLKSQNNDRELLQEYESALALYQGDFLSQDLYSEWSTDVRDGLRASYLRVLEEAGALADSTGDRDKALQFFERMFLTEPSSERACRWLMARYHSLGKRGDAVRTYERCERALSRDMDLEPEEKTKRLYRSIIGG